MSTLKQSASLVRGQDWRVPKDTTYPTQESLMALQCPFEIGPSEVTNIPTEQLKNIVFGTIGQPLDTSMEAPWSGYYTYHNGTWHAVTPFYFLRLILSGAHYHLVLIFCIYLVLPAFAAYRTSVLTQDYQDLDT